MTNPEILDEEIGWKKLRQVPLLLLEYALLLSYAMLIFFAASSLYLAFFKSGDIFEELFILSMSSLNLSYIWLSRDFMIHQDKGVERELHQSISTVFYISILVGGGLIILSIVIPYLNSPKSAELEDWLAFLPFGLLGIGQIIYSFRTKSLIKY